jgi:beta-glucosidase
MPGRQINIRHARINGRVRVPDALQYICGCGSTHEAAAELALGLGDSAYIKGLQEKGVGACLKHFACNNSEIERTTMSSEVDERALREIYFAVFERAISRAHPWTMMSSYNLLNGEQVSASRRYLTDVLRGELGFDGLIISDWHGIKDRPASLIAGNDLDMPESAMRRAAALAALQDGSLSREHVDAAVQRMLVLLQRVKEGELRDAPVPFIASHETARRAAEQSIVLLKNSEHLLPLDATAGRILVVGREAVSPSVQGSGSAMTNPIQLDIPLDEISALAGESCHVHYHPGFDSAPDDAEIEELAAAAAEADTIIVFAGTAPGMDGEASDRRNLRLAPGQDDMITTLGKAHNRVIVVLSMPDAVEMPWSANVSAILGMFFPGQAGGSAVARLLFEEVNPSGKLTVTFPEKQGDIPGIHSYPGEAGKHLYSEGIYVGYRSYDLRQVAVQFPFGHGLSYTEFGYSEIKTDVDRIERDGSVQVNCTVTNTGKRAGAEIVQVYVRPQRPALRRPLRELKSFAKVYLAPGQSQQLNFKLEQRDFMYFDPEQQSWVLNAEAFIIEMGRSSRDIALSVELPCAAMAPPFRRLRSDTQPKYVLENPAAVRALSELLAKTHSISLEEAESILRLTKGWFLGIHQSLSWYVGKEMDAAEMDAALETVNCGSQA